jgi:hypothetical protein
VHGKIIKPMLQVPGKIDKVAGDMSQLQVFHECFVIIKLLVILAIVHQVAYGGVLLPPTNN